MIYNSNRTKIKISKSKDFGFSYVAIKGNNINEFLLNNRKKGIACELPKTIYNFPII